MLPVLRLEPHNERWAKDFECEAALIRSVLGSTLKAVHHIGSTSIGPIYAKPIVDMVAEVESLEAAEHQQEELVGLGYIAMGEFGISGRRYFRKNDQCGTRTHHLHIFVAGSPHVARHLAFRDYLRAHPAAAREYSDLKLAVAKSCPDDMEAYMDGKDVFIKRVERDALAWHSQSFPGSGIV
jgi:GrpB-like predicted nucleotidyltransferase (UPF0157 family)